MQPSRRSKEKGERTLLQFDTHSLVLVSTKLAIVIIKCLFFWVYFELCFSHPLSLFCTIAVKGRESPPMGHGPALFRTKPSPLPLPEECACGRGEGGSFPHASLSFGLQWSWGSAAWMFRRHRPASESVHLTITPSVGTT